MRLGRDPKGPLRFRCGAVERALPAGRQLEFIAPSPGGLLQILEGETQRRLFELGVNFLDESETQPAQSVDRRCRSASPTSRGLRAESGPASDPLFWLLLTIGGDGDGGQLVPAPARPEPRMSLEAMSDIRSSHGIITKDAKHREEEQTHSLTLRALRDFAIFVTLS